MNKLPDNLPAGEAKPGLRENQLWLNGQPVPLLCGEIQFFRMEPSSWEPALQQAKKLGLPMVSTYLSWRRFSIGPDQNDLTGCSDPRLNLPAFLKLCQKMGLWVTLKPGPWICAEETNGGYPDWLIQDPAVQVLDSQDRPVQGYNPPFQSPIPSYLHPTYQEHVRRWLEDVDNLVRDFCYPAGPIVLVQLDNEPCQTFHDRMFESDYNPVNVGQGGWYSRFLQEKYKTVDQLNRCHRSSWQNFDEVQAPRSLQIQKLEELPGFMDWVEFKEWLLAEEVSRVGAMHRKNGLERVIFTINFNEHPQLAVPNNWKKIEQASELGGYDYYPNMPMDQPDMIKMAQAVNYSRCVNRVVWSPEIMCGIWNFSGQPHAPDHLKAAEYEYLYRVCLAYGLKGMNYYMLADRDNWVNSPLDDQGRPTPTIQAVERTLQVMNSVPDFYNMEVEQPVGVFYYRPYAREAYLAQETPTVVDGYALGQAYDHFKLVYDELFRLNCNPGLVDLWANPESLKKFKMVWVPAGAYMDADSLRLLKQYAQDGGRVIFSPAVPSLDLDFNQISEEDLLCSASSGEQKIQPGQGEWIVAQVHKDSRAWIQETLRRYDLLPRVESDHPEVFTTLQRNSSHVVLSVINTGNSEVAAGLSFKQWEPGQLVNVLTNEQVLPVRDGKTLVHVQPHSVATFLGKLNP